MTGHRDFLKNNEQYVANFGDGGSLAMPPTQHLTVVTCMDARIDPYSQLGVKLGSTHIIRNAGGSGKDALRSIVISQRLLGTREIAVFHHTDCGMLTFNTPQLRDIVKKAEPDNTVVAREVDAIEFLEFPDAAEAVKQDVKYLKEHPLVLKGTEITGWLYDVKTGKASQIVPSQFAG